MRYYVRYLHFLDYCPHLCRQIYHNVSPIVCSGLLQMVGMLNLTLNFASSSTSHVLRHWLDPVTYPKSVSSIPGEGSGELSEGKLTADN